MRMKWRKRRKPPLDRPSLCGCGCTPPRSGPRPRSHSPLLPRALDGHLERTAKGLAVSPLRVGVRSEGLPFFQELDGLGIERERELDLIGPAHPQALVSGAGKPEFAQDDFL